MVKSTKDVLDMALEDVISADKGGRSKGKGKSKGGKGTTASRKGSKGFGKASKPVRVEPAQAKKKEEDGKDGNTAVKLDMALEDVIAKEVRPKGKGKGKTKSKSRDSNEGEWRSKKGDKGYGKSSATKKQEWTEPKKGWQTAGRKIWIGARPKKDWEASKKGEASWGTRSAGAGRRDEWKKSSGGDSWDGGRGWNPDKQSAEGLKAENARLKRELAEAENARLKRELAEAENARLKRKLADHRQVLEKEDWKKGTSWGSGSRDAWSSGGSRAGRLERENESWSSAKDTWSGDRGRGSSAKDRWAEEPPARRAGSNWEAAGPGAAGRSGGASAGERGAKRSRDEDPATTASRGSAGGRKRIKVSNLPRDLDWRDIKDAFEREAGKVSRCEVDGNQVWISFLRGEDARKAVETFDRGELNGRTIGVTLEV